MNQQCKVCGEPAAGFHFGAFTCEGCKSFFGRTYNNMSSISECKNNGDCIINKKNRTSCKSCRLRKCLLVGMSKSGSRYGRRSNWFKIHCLLQEQGSSANSVANGGLHHNFMSSNGTSLYPGLFGPRHMLSTDKFLEARLNGFSPFSDGKHSTKSEPERYKTSPDRYRSSSDESGPESSGEDESRCASAISRGQSSSHHTPSPFSEKDFSQNQKKSSNSPNITNLNNNNNNNKNINNNSVVSAFTSPFSCSNYVPPILRPLASHLTNFPVINPRPITALTSVAAATPPTANVLYFDALASTHWNSRNGREPILLCSSAPGAAALAAVVDQEQPIDLSTKSPENPNTSSSRSSAESNTTDRTVPSPDLNSNENNIKNLHIPLDLTSKRRRELLS